MALDLTNDQINQLKSLGILPETSTQTISKSTVNISKEIENTQELAPNIGETSLPPISSSRTFKLLPLLSISGLTFLSFGGIILLKNRDSQGSQNPSLSPTQNIGNAQITPTQVPKSIQHYLLTSQQFFTQALEAQNSKSPEAVNYLNQSILTASEAIKSFPSDSRAYEQRGRIYLSLIDSQPKLLTTAITDLAKASQLNPNSAELTRTLATLYAKQGDAKNTLAYLAQTVSLEPTKPQNFYDLARLQQQTGLLPEALETYNRLVTIITDPTQKIAIENEKSAIEKLLSQSPSKFNTTTGPSISPSTPVPSADGPLLQADNGTGLIIAAPETAKDISVSNLTSSNSLTGSGILPANTKQISISNSNLTDTSQVYLTVVKGGKNLVLQVLSKSANSFVVGLDSPTTEDIEFKWWIIN